MIHHKVVYEIACMLKYIMLFALALGKYLCKCQILTFFRGSCPEVFCKKGVLRNLAKLKHLCQSLFYNKVVGWRKIYNILKALQNFLHSAPFLSHDIAENIHDSVQSHASMNLTFDTERQTDCNFSLFLFWN